MGNNEANLNKLQAEILAILYKFRFATRDLIVNYQELKSSTYTHYRLTNLLENGYISRRYSGKDKIAGKPAMYYLSNAGIKYLAHHTDLNPKVLNLIYKDKYASDSFIEDCLNVFRIYINYRDKYGGKIDFYTKSETAEYSYFLKPNPHAYITFESTDLPEYFIELITVKTPYFAIRRRINQYIKHYSSDIWQIQTGKPYPELLLVVDDQNLENRLQKTIAATLDNQGITEIKIKNLRF